MGKGHALLLSGLVIAAVARDRRVSVYSTDPHFDLIDGLKRYIPCY